jgi:hypothetical protein
VLGSAALILLGISIALPASAEPLTARQLRSEISGNTLSGFNTSGVVFSEYHSPDGRIFGHNNGEAVVDGCWDIKDDAVCYYYSAWRHRAGTFCWRYDRAGENGYRITSVESRVTGLTRLEPGNPHGHSDNGKPWACEGLVSGFDRPRRMTAR